MNKIKCKNCGAEIEVSEALKRDVEEQIIVAEREKYKKELDEVIKKAEQDAARKASKDFELQLINLKKDKEEEGERNTKLLKQLEKLSDEIRDLRRKDEERELEMKKRLANEEEKIVTETRKKTLAENELKDKEKDKKLQDALKQIEELKKGMQQGSQQTQGEVMELEMEELIKKEFPTDEILEVKKGQRGGDIVQIVMDEKGRKCGIILWELKNAQWSDSWLAKLRQDQRVAKAQIAVLVTVNLPVDIETLAFRDGIWITKINTSIGLATALRRSLISIYAERQNKIGKDEKMEVLYQYLTGVEFQHRVEGIAEAFNNLQEDIERERRWFTTKWARQEKEIRRIIDNTHGMYGDLQSVTGRALQQIKNFELPSGEEKSDTPEE